ncbi:MAG: LppX_LprAFG lipoprotein [Actinomycetota bacterium]|nr:LppX_LprAFG lipoprotein [Actinomycetota bacterium]
MPVPPTARRGVALLAAIASLGTLTACSHSSSSASATPTALPSAQTLLDGASSTMAGVTSARFSLQMQGSLGGLNVRKADGVLTSAGAASGTADLEEFGQLIEFDVVILNGTVYVKGPTGGFTQIPQALTGGFYDPTKLLDPQAGLSRLLATASDARTVGTDDVGGTSAYRVEATLDGRVLSTLVPVPANKDAPSVLWISTDSSRLVQVKATLPAEGSGPPTVVNLGLSDFDVPVTITPPA